MPPETNVNILVVDDEEIMRSLFTDILHDVGYRVTTVQNGKEAGEKAKSEFFDVVFIDVHMPVMDGVKTLKLFRQLSPKTAIVMMDSMPDYLGVEFKEGGAFSCIHKPFNIQEVRSILSRIMENRGRAKDNV